MLEGQPEQDFFFSPWFYEEIEEGVLRLLMGIAAFVAVDPNNVRMPEEASVFRKIRDHRNVEWAQRFAKDLANQDGKRPRIFPGWSKRPQT